MPPTARARSTATPTQGPLQSVSQDHDVIQLETAIFRGLLEHRPVGSAKTSALTALHKQVQRAIDRDVTKDEIWAKLEELYNFEEVERLDELALLEAAGEAGDDDAESEATDSKPKGRKRKGARPSPRGRKRKAEDEEPGAEEDTIAEEEGEDEGEDGEEEADEDGEEDDSHLTPAARRKRGKAPSPNEPKGRRASTTMKAPPRKKGRK